MGRCQMVVAGVSVERRSPSKHPTRSVPSQVLNPDETPFYLDLY